MREVVILGSGPAGLAAAIYAARADLKPLVVSGPQPGGQLTTTTEVENWPGEPDGIDGTALIEKLKKQAQKFGTEFKEGWVTDVDVTSVPKRLIFDGGEVVETRAVVVATGASAMYLNVPGEDALKTKGVSACATCDGFFFRDKDVVVIGGGDVAMEEAIFLTKFATSVTVIHRRDTLRASKPMQERAFANPKIHFVWNTEVVEVMGVDAGHVTGVRTKNNQTGEEKTIEAQGYFAAIGHKPNTDVFLGQLAMSEKGYLQLEAGSTRTSVEGVFAAGDVADHVYRQAITAAGTGCAAALDAERWLSEQRSF
ncbi:TPA: thioredoxin-disulfide reductase [Candidatus Uhrbacteria bacterium]|nr:thioredoxin-disulfide reductase [Candidatus Uhrbacteria bacterium]